MLHNSITQTVQVQESLEVVTARKYLDAVVAWGKDAAKCEVYQGKFLIDLQARYQTLEPDSTWKAFVAGNCNISYRTARRRIRAAEWHTEYGVDLETLARCDAARLDDYRDIITEENVDEVVNDLLPVDAGGAGLSDLDMHIKWLGMPDEPAPEDEKPKAKVVRVHCPHCDTDFEAEVEK